MNMYKRLKRDHLTNSFSTNEQTTKYFENVIFQRLVK